MPRPRHVYETYIRTTPERLWAALTDPDLTRRYFYGCGLDTVVAPGEAYAYRGDDGAAAIDGTIEEAEPFRRLVMTFHVAFDPDAAHEHPSRVTWEITPLGEVCRLSLVHGDLHGAPHTYAITATGWPPLVSSLKTLLETGEALPAVPDDRADEPPPDVDRELHREQGIDANNLVWQLLETADRTAADDDRMVHAAHASAFHWDIAGTDVNRARAEYMCSRAYAFAGRGEPALHHARRCLAIVQANDLTDFDLAYANEAMARALAARGELAGASEYLKVARATPVADDDDRAIVVADLAAGPWYGVE